MGRNRERHATPWQVFWGPYIGTPEQPNPAGPKPRKPQPWHRHEVFIIIVMVILTVILTAYLGGSFYR
jgi:hypothetical protein